MGEKLFPTWMGGIIELLKWAQICDFCKQLGNNPPPPQGPNIHMLLQDPFSFSFTFGTHIWKIEKAFHMHLYCASELIAMQEGWFATAFYHFVFYMWKYDLRPLKS